MFKLFQKLTQKKQYTLTNYLSRRIRVLEKTNNFLSLANMAPSINDSDIPELVTFLNTQPQITDLDLSVNNIGDEGAKKLGALLYVTNLNLARNNIRESFDHLVKKPWFYLNLEANDLKPDFQTSRPFLTPARIKSIQCLSINLEENNLPHDLLDLLEQQIKDNRSRFLSTTLKT
jgi:hypothetical protein